MDNLDFILWMTLFPISISIASYIDEKKYNIKGQKKVYKEDVEAMASIFILLLWLGIGFYLL